MSTKSRKRVVKKTSDVFGYLVREVNDGDFITVDSQSKFTSTQFEVDPGQGTIIPNGQRFISVNSVATTRQSTSKTLTTGCVYTIKDKTGVEKDIAYRFFHKITKLSGEIQDSNT